MPHQKIKFLTECAVFAALLCVLSPITVPIGPVPFSLLVFAVMLCGVVLPLGQGMVSVFVFLLLGLFLPIFSGGNTGVSALPGPTGGYIWSSLLMIPVIQALAGTQHKKHLAACLAAFAGCVLSLAVCYLCGTLQFSRLAGKTFSQSLSVCVIPFILPDLVKAAAAAVLGVTVRELLRKNQLL